MATKNSKKEVKNVAVENAQVENIQAVVEATQIEATQVENRAAQAKAEAEALMAQAKEAAQKAKEAAKAAKAAAQKAKAFGARPIRSSYFVAYYSDDTAYQTFISKSDVHYVVEKAAIDEVARQREMGEEFKTVLIYKINKQDENNVQLISQVYIASETKQIVID
jgi:uncharacterized protein (DUF3084 family)